MPTSLLVAILACLPGETRDENVASANGRFIVELSGSTMALRQKGAATPRWSVPRPGADRVVVADSGEWVAALESPRDERGTHLMLYDASGKPSELRPLDLLSEEEHQFLPFSDCGIDWLARVTADGDVVTIEVPQGGNVRPTEDPGPTMTIKLDARRGTLTRGAPVPRPGIPELIAEHQREKTGMAFELLTAKASLQAHRGDRALCTFFASVVQGKDVRLRSRAMDSLVAAECGPELATLSAKGPRGDEADTALLEGLVRTDPPAAARFAMQALKGREGPSLVRSRAARLLIEKSNPLRFDAARLALADEASVRGDAISALSTLPRSPEAFALLLAAAVVRDEATERARYAALDYLRDPREPAWPQQFAEAHAAGKLDAWAGASVVAAGLAEQRGEPAEELYRRAIVRLERDKSKRAEMDEELWCEAKLRLAQLAAAQGKKDVAVAIAKEVLASNSSAMVTAPQPNRYAGGRGGRSASSVAQEIVSSGGVPPAPPPSMQDALKIMRETKQRMEEQRLKRNAAKQ